LNIGIGIDIIFENEYGYSHSISDMYLIDSLVKDKKENKKKLKAH